MQEQLAIGSVFFHLVFCELAQCCHYSPYGGKTEDLVNPVRRWMASQVGVFVMLLVTRLEDNNGRRVIGGGHGQ